jgi:hypothetical protein
MPMGEGMRVWKSHFEYAPGKPINWSTVSVRQIYFNELVDKLSPSPTLKVNHTSNQDTSSLGDEIDQIATTYKVAAHTDITAEPPTPKKDDGDHGLPFKKNVDSPETSKLRSDLHSHSTCLHLSYSTLILASFLFMF